MPDSDATPVDLEDLRRTVADVLDVDVSDVTDDAHFADDLGGDSLLALEVVVALEKTYAVKFTEAELAKLTSLPNTYHLVVAKLGAR